MDGRKALPIRDWPEYPELVRRPRGAHIERERRISRRWGVFAALVGPAVAVFAMALEPAPADPEAGASVLGALMSFALLASWIGAAADGVRRRPAALGWVAGAGALSLVMAVSCPITGHHAAIGTWWYGQMAVSASVVAAALYGLRFATGRASR